MSSSALPGSVNYVKLAQQSASLQGHIQLSRLHRLSEQLLASGDQAVVTIEFFRDDQRRYRISGRVEGQLSVACQRCLGPVSVAVAADLELALVHSDAMAAQLPAELEPVLVEGEELDVHCLIEDELLLALPMINTHSEACGEQRYFQGVESPRRQKPFSGLAELLGKQGI